MKARRHYLAAPGVAAVRQPDRLEYSIRAEVWQKLPRPVRQTMGREARFSNMVTGARWLLEFTI